MERFLEIDGIRLYYQRCGIGKPLLMIPGLGAGEWLWAKSKNALAEQFDLIMPELRGSGRSDKPDMHYSVALFARDLHELLRQLSIEKVHLLGVSMGGFVAQYFAARWSKTVDRLVLVSTSLGGQCQIGPNGNVLSRIIRPHGKTKRERLEDAYTLNFTKQYMRGHAEEIMKITEWRVQFPQPEFAYYRQLLAGNAYNGEKIAERIAAQTLICAGIGDMIVPVENAHALKAKITDATLRIFEGKHLFLFEHSEAFHSEIIEFLSNCV